MHAIDTPLSQNGQFVGRNLGSGTPGTKISADWLNSIQNEIISVIEAEGIALDKKKKNQLLASINSIVDRKINEAITNTVTEQRVVELINQHAVTWE